MASHYQTVPPIRNQQKFRLTSDVVKTATQLSINQNDSPLTAPSQSQLASAKLFTYRRNINANGNLLFPLEEKHETSPKFSTEIEWHDLLKYFKSQSIVKNMDILNKFHKYHFEIIKDHQKTFPLANKQSSSYMTNFPCQTSMQHNDDLHINNEKVYFESTKYVKKLQFPLKKLMAGKETRFPCKSQSVKDKSKKSQNVALQKLNTNLDSLCSIKDLQNYNKAKELKTFPCMRKTNTNVKDQFPLQNITELPKFCEKFSLILGKFTKTELKSTKNILIDTLWPKLEDIILMNENNIKTPKLFNNYEVNFENKSDSKKFPCRTSLKGFNLKKFPLNEKINSFNSIYNKSGISSISISLPVASLIMTYKGQHLSQVQDAQFLSTSTIFEQKQTPPQTTLAKIPNNDHNDVYKLPAINNAINNTRSNEVGLFEEKIERIQDAIVALFEKIQNSFRQTHNVSEHDEKTNAINRNDDGNSNGNSVVRFALTPPTNSITSVRNTERIFSTNNNNNNDVHNRNICNDLCDLWHDASDQHGKIVESSDVRDTLTEAVDYGVRNDNPTTRTGSLLFKSEKPIPPHTPLPQPLTESISTSFERSDIFLPTYNVLRVNLENNNNINNLEVDISTKLNDAFVINELSTETKQNDNKLITNEKSDMTITRLGDNENSCLQFRETFVESNNTLVNDIEIDEMKYEMNRTKGALPSSALSDSRVLGKHETLKTGNAKANYNRNTSSNLTTRPSRDINNSTPSLSAIERLSLKSENLRTPIKTYTTPDVITNRSNLTPSTNLSNDSVANRSITPLQKSINASNDILGNRRPSLTSLRNTQSTSFLSQDLASYNPALINTQKDQKTALTRGASVDSSLEIILPERTRLRRQRRFRSQYSKDEPEDPIERLNRLKARISASLSEVKGVLKQYSTDGETENEIVTTPFALSSQEIKNEEKKEDEGPVKFRFIKKIRRRSVFDEDEEEKEQKKDADTGNDEVDYQHKATSDINLESREVQLVEVAKETKHDEVLRKTSPEITDSKESSQLVVEDNLDLNTDINKNLYTVKEVVQEALEETISQLKEQQKTDNKKLNVKKPEVSVKKQDIFSDSKVKITESIEAFLPIEGSAGKSLKEAPFQVEVKIEQNIKDSNTAPDVSKQLKTVEEEKKPQTFKAESLKGAIRKQTEPDMLTLKSDSKNKSKKTILNKSKDPTRRASLAAVEGSKIEPPVKVAIPAKILRRPSDSEAVVKKKLITTKINTSGSIEEVTPKPKIVKVKRSLTKSNAQLATAQAKTTKEEESAMIAENNQSNDRVKSTDDRKMINNDKNKDVLMPKVSKNNQITSQTNLLLPTQLVIDEAASLKTEIIENSQLQLQSNQKQEQVQKQTQQQATTKSKTTKLKSNELQKTCGNGGAMLENLTTTAISSTKTTESNGQQIKRENETSEQEDLYDLLQQETIIVKPSATKQVQQVFGKALEKDHTSLQQLTSLAQQQVVATTDIVVVKNDDTSNKKENEIDETRKSSIEPCAVKTPTSTHIVVHEHEHYTSLVEGEQSITHKTDTKAINSPHISISSTAGSIQNRTKTEGDELLKDCTEEVNQNKNNIMPEQQLAPAPVQAAEVLPQREHHKKKVVLKKIVRQASIDKTKKQQSNVFVAKEVDKNETVEVKDDITLPIPDRVLESPAKDESTEDISESTEISESSFSQGSEETTATSDDKPKKERKIKKKVIIKRQKRRLSIGDNFFHPATDDDPQNSEVETLEKAISYFTDDDDDEQANSQTTEEDEEAKMKAQAEEEEEEKLKKPLKSCILHKEYNIGDEVLYAERFKKTQIKWRHGRIKERITSISYLLDIDGKDVSSHVNYLKKFTGRKVSFGGKEYLEIDYEQLAEEEERAEKLQRRTYSIWNMV